jgi:hypothetical protein
MRRLWIASLPLCAVLLVSANAYAEDFYKYRGREGRMVYTNITEQVPVDQREQGKLDLSRIPLNSELGAELDRRFEQEHAELRESSYCQALLAEAGEDLLKRIWEDYAPLVVCGGVLLAFLLFTPFALRRYGAPVWAKTLMMAIPSLAIGGLVSFTMMHTNRTISQLKERVKPCTAETFDRLRAEPDALAKRSQLIEQLKREMGLLDPGVYGMELGAPHDRPPPMP